MQVHLAQFNTATLRQPIDHPDNASFVALLDETNARAEASPGFVWRHGIDSRDSSVQVYDDPLTLVNASVWESLTALRDDAYTGFHRDVFRRRAEWFDGSGAECTRGARRRVERSGQPPYIDRIMPVSSLGWSSDGR